MVPMRPIQDLSHSEAQRLSGLLFDLDDTFLTEGQIVESAFSALYRLRESGLELYAVTGRPAGWGRLMAMQWPVDGVVTENGAVLFHRVGHRIQQLDRLDLVERQARTRKLELVKADLLAKFPELKPTDDAGFRVSDLTFDIGEHEQVSPERVNAMMNFIRDAGVQAIRSSVHLHLSDESDDKASGTLRLLQLLKQRDPTEARYAYAFIGDSENDAACFTAFHTTIGVQNLRGTLTQAPRYTTLGARAAGFTEAANQLLTARTR